ncbi:hypothetical protein [Phytoactinopolyspora mesophila]|uniref:Uncharacterized protein n=1 Tax=Phytoactinopolyspora mesophila TaxID=2650750 RepID=A0A7K3M5M0_9ACTN|nr:hypothetical protein [Phytoactinopolyspora mesophila]NDL58619.1 hypothetical protein [Phytoactinopolyspora mesophila]
MDWDNPDADFVDEIRGLVGHKKGISKDGEAIPIEESVRALVGLEQKERELVMQFSEKCVKAGLNERLVKLAEQQAQMMAGAIESVLGKLNLTSDQQAIAGEIVVLELEKLANGNVPEVPAEVLESVDTI